VKSRELWRSGRLDLDATLAGRLEKFDLLEKRTAEQQQA
jgi:hypothetical protein